MPNFIAVTSEKHKNTKVKRDLSFSHFKSQHLAPLVVHEFATAAHEYPIFFVKDNNSEDLRSVVLLGLKPGENLYYDEQKWKSNYIPEALIGYPFALANDPNNKDQQLLVVDEESERLNSDEGDALFDDDGKQTEFTTQLAEFLSAGIDKQFHTQAFIKKLQDLNLLINKSLDITITDKKSFSIDGIFMVDEAALNKLSDKDFLELRKLGYLAPIYASLLSMSKVSHLLKLLEQSA